jgi:hypothetical protein
MSTLRSRPEIDVTPISPIATSISLRIVVSIRLTPLSPSAASALDPRAADETPASAHRDRLDHVQAGVHDRR